MRESLKKTVAVMLVVCCVVAAFNALAETTSERDERMAWWREARFGMFIHWGLYAVAGGEWKGVDYGKEMGGPSAEWLQLQAMIPKEEYSELAKEFNPVKFNANLWARTAKRAGMKYMVITAKHHDGFSMFDSTMTDYDIIDATPFKRDVIKELAGACRQHGIKFGVYYSHSKDWYNRKLMSKDPEPPSPDYVAFVKGQLRELLTEYGDMAIIWFDTGDQFTEINTQYGEIVKKMQPKTLLSGRLRGREGMSDYAQEGDRSIPGKRVETDSEVPMTMRDNWGYDKDDDNWKSVADLLERLSLTVCRGGNMLLNVGPRPDGTLCPEEMDRLRSIGRWMDANGESIYGTTGSPFDFDFAWGSISQKPGKLYLHVLKWYPTGIEFVGLKSKIQNAYLLNDETKTPLGLTQDAKSGFVKVHVPHTAPDENVNVIVLEFDGKVEVDKQAGGVYHWTKDTGITLQKDAVTTPPKQKKPKQSQGNKPRVRLEPVPVINID
jgi:alpha-L-fucosidase